jgi:hypothetical protein
MLCFAIPSKPGYLSDSLKVLNGSRGSLAQLFYRGKYIQERLKMYGFDRFYNSTCLICHIYKDVEKNTVEMLPLRYARLVNVSREVDTFSFEFKLEALTSISSEQFKNILLKECHQPHIFQPPVNLVFETKDIFQFHYSYSLQSWEETLDRLAKIVSENKETAAYSDLVLSAQLYVLGVTNIDQKCSSHDPSVFYWSERLENHKHYNLVCYAYYPLVSDGIDDIVDGNGSNTTAVDNNTSNSEGVREEKEGDNYKLEPTNFYINSSQNIEILIGYPNEVVVEKKRDLIQIPFMTNVTSADEFRWQHGFICAHKRMDDSFINTCLRFEIENNKCC